MKNIHKAILIASGNEFGKQVALKDHHKGQEIAMIDLSILTINGIRYKKRERESKSSKSSGIYTLMAAICNYGYETKTPRKRPLVNIEKEFELIQNKKSELCRNDRDWVCNQFKYIYEEVK